MSGNGEQIRKKGFVLFNRNLNVLGNAEQTRLEELPLERFNVEEIPLEGEVVEEHAGFTDVFFYTDLTNPYAGYVLNLQKYIFCPAMANKSGRESPQTMQSTLPCILFPTLQR